MKSKSDMLNKSERAPAFEETFDVKYSQVSFKPPDGEDGESAAPQNNSINVASYFRRSSQGSLKSKNYHFFITPEVI